MESERQKKHKVPFFSSLQVKYAMSYLVIFAVVLVLMNTYPVVASQDLLFRSKRDSLKSQAAVMASALMELETLSSDQVVRVMNMLDSVGLTRILVTDPAGLVLYDSQKDGVDQEQDQDQEETEEPAQTEYSYALYQEVVLALKGKDVFCSKYVNKVFVSTVAMPIVYRGMIIGAIYIVELDADQGALLLNLQQNLRSISLVIAVVTDLVISGSKTSIAPEKQIRVIMMPKGTESQRCILRKNLIIAMLFYRSHISETGYIGCIYSHTLYGTSRNDIDGINSR